MAGKKRALLDAIAAGTEQITAAYAEACEALRNVPVGGRTYTESFTYCENRLDPALVKLLEAMRGMNRPLQGLTAYIKKVKWNLFKKEAKASAEQCRTTAQAFLTSVRTRLATFRDDELSEAQKDVVLRASRTTKGLMEELVEE